MVTHARQHISHTRAHARLPGAVVVVVVAVVQVRRMAVVVVVVRVLMVGVVGVVQVHIVEEEAGVPMRMEVVVVVVVVKAGWLLRGLMRIG